MRDEYLRLRRAGWRAAEAWRAAKINTRFAELEAAGVVRLNAEPDQCITIEDVIGEGASERETKAITARVERDGVWVVFTEYLDPVDGWTIADSCGGFIGDDYEDSGYDADLRDSAIQAFEATPVELIEGWL